MVNRQCNYKAKTKTIGKTRGRIYINMFLQNKKTATKNRREMQKWDEAAAV